MAEGNAALDHSSSPSRKASLSGQEPSLPHTPPGLFGEFVRRAATRDSELPPLRDWVDLAEAWRIAVALEQCRGNRSAAARTLGIGRRTLYSKLEKLGLLQAWEPRSDQDR